MKAFLVKFFKNYGTMNIAMCCSFFYDEPEVPDLLIKESESN